MSDYIINNGELLHYGVKGMRWGVRRSEAQLGRGRSATRKGSSDADRQRRLKTAKKVAIGATAIVTVAAAATIYARNKKQIDAFVKSKAASVITSQSVKRGIRENKKAARRNAYAQRNKSSILKSARKLNKYKDYFDEKTVEKAVKNLQRTRDLHNLAQDDIRRGANYAQAILAYGTAATAAYNMKNSQLAKDIKKERKKKANN